MLWRHFSLQCRVRPLKHNFCLSQLLWGLWVHRVDEAESQVGDGWSGISLTTVSLFCWCESGPSAFTLYFLLESPNHPLGVMALTRSQLVFVPESCPHSWCMLSLPSVFTLSDNWMLDIFSAGGVSGDLCSLLLLWLLLLLLLLSGNMLWILVTNMNQ